MKKQKVLNIGYLYGDIMNTYGDVGNIITLTQRAEWRGIKVNVQLISLGDKLDESKIDLYFFGGGQDAGQVAVGDDLISLKQAELKKAVERGVPLLAICGGYQLLGEYYLPADGDKIPGANILPVFTRAGNNRMIGNIVIDSRFGKLVGFENHSGQTKLKSSGEAFGKVISGFGNNGQDQTEGCSYKNAIGCYMHGSLLPKNTVFADWLIKTALEVKYAQKIELEPLDDAIEQAAHQAAIERFSKSR